MTYLKTIALSALLATNVVALHSQAIQQSQSVSALEPTSFTQTGVVHVAGLEETKPNVAGSLSLSTSTLTFSNKSVSTAIPCDRILNVFTGDQRTEPWGTTGKIARKVIPYGGGEVLATITNKKVDLLTIEYRDTHDAYHGAVFVLPVKSAAAARDQILAHLAPQFEQQASSCAEPLPGTVLVSPVQASNIELPAEYRILIYEQMIKELHAAQPAVRYLRAGDRSSGPGCAALTLNIIVTDFKKGNRALRASTGPIGFFVGKTSLTYDVSLKDAHDTTVFDTKIRKNDRTDSESLGLADTIAKEAAKRLSKVREIQAVQIASLR